MRGTLAGLIIALVIVLIALFVAALGALGIAAIGWLLSRWFDLTQWQGSLIALPGALGIGYALYRMSGASPTASEPEWIEWEEPDEDVEPSESPIVPWRRQRPIEGNLSPKEQKPGAPRRK